MESGFVGGKLTFFRQLLQCSYPIYSWVCDSEGNLLDTDCGSLGLWDVFVRSDCLEYTLDCKGDVPVCLSTLLGMVWGAAFEDEDSERRIHVIGPVLNAELPQKIIEDAARQLVSEVTWRKDFIRMVTALPIAPVTLFYHYILMLHFCVTGERITASDIQYQSEVQHQNDRSSQGQERQPLRDRYQTYMAEKQLLYHVREGDLNYKGARARAASLSNGVRVKTVDPIEQVRISTIGFTTLCTRAAIEGGLTPDTAYTVGDAYIQSMLGCKTISELGALNNTMYEDFIRRVHKARINRTLSKPIHECCEYIQMHTEEELSISSLAALCGYTDYYLSRKFKNETGVNITDYIKFARVEKSKMLLTATKDPVQKIAKQMQFCSSSYFSKTFQQVTGMTPQQWREQYSF